MLIIKKTPFISRRKPPRVAPAVAAFTLVEASWDSALVQVTLRFSRAIDIAGIIPSAITVYDGQFAGYVFEAVAGATLVDPSTVRLDTTDIDLAFDPVVRLNATAASGIVAVNDGSSWAGVVNLPLPFP